MNEKANSRYVLKQYHKDVRDEELLDDLRRTAKMLGKDTVGMIEYREHGGFADTTVSRRFGSWNSALQRAGLGQSDFSRIEIPDEELFENLERVWATLGRQPVRRDMVRPTSNCSWRPYTRRFGTWPRALEAFTRWVKEDAPNHGVATAGEIRSRRRTNRDPNLRMKFKVFMRDSFRCQSCGRSPATHVGCILHVDHVVPWSKGGETEMGNLRTLCSECNLGKGNMREEVP
jgi:hypothetical protein